MKLGEIVKEYRGIHEMSMRDFSRITGLSNTYISMLERDYNTKTGKPIIPSISTLKVCASAMGTTLDDLVRRLDPDQIIDLIDALPSSQLSDYEERLLDVFRTLNETAQQELIGCLQRKNLNVNELFEQRSLTQEEREYLDMYRELPEAVQNHIKFSIKSYYNALDIEAQEKGIG